MAQVSGPFRFVKGEKRKSRSSNVQVFKQDAERERKLNFKDSGIRVERRARAVMANDAKGVGIACV
jgi:hypothetical protein